MSVSRMTTRFTRTLSQCRYSRILFGRPDQKHIPSFSKQLVSHPAPGHRVIPGQVSFLHHSALNSHAFQRSGFSSSASPQPNDKETAQSGIEQEKNPDTEAGKEASVSAGKTESSSGSDSDSDLEIDLSKDDLVKLVAEKDELLDIKQKELDNMKDKVLRAFAEMENVKDRTRRESENSKKFAIQNFAKGLLDVADNLGRASSTAKDSFSKIDSSEDTTGAVKQLKVLLEGVEMTEKQLAEVFKKFGLVRYDPVNEEFDPNRHNAVFQVPDASKPAGQVAVVLKAGYMLHDRIIRPAEVGVTVEANNQEA